jgi:hypothetical protein
MNDLSNIPVRTADPFAECDMLDDGVEAAWPSDDCCDLCCAVPVTHRIDSDRLCQGCYDKWPTYREDDDMLPMSHPVMREASLKYQNAADDAVGRLIADLAKGQRRFQRDFRK